MLIFLGVDPYYQCSKMLQRQCTCAIRSFRMSTTRRATYVTIQDPTNSRCGKNWKEQVMGVLESFMETYEVIHGSSVLICFNCMKQTEVIIL